MADNAREMLEALSKQLNLPPDRIQSSCERGDTGDLLKNVGSEKAKQVEAVLNDPERARALLNSPQAQALLKLLNRQ